MFISEGCGCHINTYVARFMIYLKNISQRYLFQTSQLQFILSWVVISCILSQLSCTDFLALSERPAGMAFISHAASQRLHIFIAS